ncbi:AarF/ABC1/UbiB kinase family protein [Thermopetrobacter sp. TC1]|uniref:ABC1 kinase family protein n=1 Tax=Thermopetrobacter sp. TC1 TaxID=1495045 RepID=UPI00068D9257|nr:AarF/ABC1/UbiB kinase family protein [Thermopetrobacter sp. TC1]
MNRDEKQTREPQNARDEENSRLSRRVARYARVGAALGGIAARVGGARIVGRGDREAEARALREALGNLKGPLMKVAQLLSTVPDVLPPEYAAELAKLQSNAPPMGRPFVRRRMAAELGPDWREKFAEFDLDAAAAASLGQVHKARAHDGRLLAVKLQYPDMASAVEADLAQLKVIFAIHRRLDPAIDTREVLKEITERLREELDYERELKHMKLYRHMLADNPLVHVPEPIEALSTRRLLTMTWLEGKGLLTYRDAPEDVRNRLAEMLFRAWWEPFYAYAVIHGDPHLGNYAAREEKGEVTGLNLLDFGCIRIFPPHLVGGVVELYHGLKEGDLDRCAHAYDIWGFKGLNRELIEILNIWARFIYGPVLEDRVRTMADGVDPIQFGRQEAFKVHRLLREKGPVTIPREFVFMDRAAIGLGAVFIHLGARLNFHRLFMSAMSRKPADKIAERQKEALIQAGLLPRQEKKQGEDKTS